MAIGVGLCVSNSKAILEAWLGKKSEFVRTPKYGDRENALEADQPLVRKRRKRDWLPYAEFVFGLYMSACLVASLINFRAAMTSPFLAIFAFGFFYVSVMSFQARQAARTSDRRKAVKAQA